MCKWLFESNRQYHCLIGLVCAIFGIIIGSTEVAAFEYIDNISNGKMTNQEKLDVFNQEGGNDYIWFNEFEIVE